MILMTDETYFLSTAHTQQVTTDWRVDTLIFRACCKNQAQTGCARCHIIQYLCLEVIKGHRSVLVTVHFNVKFKWRKSQLNKTVNMATKKQKTWNTACVSDSK